MDGKKIPHPILDVHSDLKCSTFTVACTLHKMSFGCKIYEDKEGIKS